MPAASATAVKAPPPPAFKAKSAPLSMKTLADRIAALIAGEEEATAVGAANGKGYAESTDQDGDAVVARRSASRTHRDQPFAALPGAALGGDHAQVRAALGGLTTRLAGARRLLLRGAGNVEVAQALHALMDAVTRLRRSATWLEADGLEALLENENEKEKRNGSTASGGMAAL